MRQHSGIGVLDKAVDILDAVDGVPASLAELVVRTGLPRATAHRLAVALELHGLLRRDAEGRFAEGRRLATTSTGDGLTTLAAPALTWLRDESGESAQLYRREGGDRVCIAVAERTTGLRTTVPVGAHLPLSAGSGAQVLCAWDPAASDPAASDPAASDPAASAPAASSSTVPFAFPDKQLAEVRRRGWAQSVGQREAGVASVSAPVWAPGGGVLAAISISGPIERLGRAPGQRFAPLVIAAAQRLMTALADV